MNTFEIIEAKPNGTVKVKFSVDNKVQTIANMPVNDADALSTALSDYGVAYEAGLAKVAPVEVAQEVADLVGVEVAVVKTEPEVAVTE